MGVTEPTNRERCLRDDVPGAAGQFAAWHLERPVPTEPRARAASQDHQAGPAAPASAAGLEHFVTYR